MARKNYRRAERDLLTKIARMPVSELIDDEVYDNEEVGKIDLLGRKKITNPEDISVDIEEEK